MVLHDISFYLPEKKVLGILGRTGSGKSTLARLLFRLYDPCVGAILLNQVDIRTMNLADLRKHIGLVTQEVQLFHASIRDNLTFFDDQISDTQILQVLHDLGLSEWYASLPEGLDAPMNAIGYGLSAGQAQLLACARVFLKNPGIVVLDEASSRLDPASERLLEKAIDKLFQNRTGIIIAHRLATVQRADDILILKDGKICEYGSRQSLIESHHSFFYRLIHSGLEEEAA
jgi:ATP-binding cassette subfamily B protein/ATP-binding cassette subfamily C protein